MRTVQYGETSLIATVYTELFGMQSYIVSGIRKISKTGAAKAGLFQPGAILDMVVYHNEFKNLQRIKEFKWGYIYEHIFSSVLKHAVAIYMIELTQKSIREPEENVSLYHFIEDALIHLDKSKDSVTANFPLYFTLHLMTFLGLQMANAYDAERSFFDLKEGEFVRERPLHPHYLNEHLSYLSSELLKVMQPAELSNISLNQITRRELLDSYLQFYALHIQDFGNLKTISVIKTIL